MNDSLHVDNFTKPDVVSGENHYTPIPDMNLPGKRNSSTPLGEKIRELQQQESPGDALIIKAFQESIKDQQKNEGHPDEDNISSHFKKNIEPKKTAIINTQKNNQVVKQGFLAPFINGFNNSIEAIWNALKSLIPMKPQTGAG